MGTRRFSEVKAAVLKTLVHLSAPVGFWIKGDRPEMKRIIYPGDRANAPCERCGDFMPATFDYGTVTLEDGTPVEDVMRATCDGCGLIVATAPQSAPRFRSAIEARAKRKQQTNVRISRTLADIARMALTGHRLDPERMDLLVKAFAMTLTGHSAASSKRWSEAAARLQAAAQDRALQLPQDEAVQLYLTDPLRRLLEKLQQDAGLLTFSELVRRVLLVVPGDKKTGRELEKLSLVG